MLCQSLSYLFNILNVLFAASFLCLKVGWFVSILFANLIKPTTGFMLAVTPSTAPPPPPPPSSLPEAASKQPAAGSERSALLGSIQGFQKGSLKKAQTVDKSAPKI